MDGTGKATLRQTGTTVWLGKREGPLLSRKCFPEMRVVLCGADKSSGVLRSEYHGHVVGFC